MIVAVEPYDAVSSTTDGRRPRRRRGAAARPRRHPRARQRARPHRVGGLRDRHPGRRGGRRHHPARHAAQQHPAHVHGRGAADQAEVRRRALPRRRRLLGRRDPRQPRRPARPARRGRVRLQVLPRPVRCGRVPAAPGRRAGPLPRRAGRVRRDDDRPRRGRRRARARPGGERAGVRQTSSPPARAASRTSRSRSSSRPPGTPGPPSTCCTCPARTRCRCCARPGATGIAITVETCPHYLVFEAASIAAGATQFKCCPPIREADNREDLWAALGPRRHRLRRLRPLALRARAEGPRPRRLRHGMGRHLVAADRPARRVDGGAAARARPRRRRALDGPAPRRDRGPHPQGPDRARLRRRPRRVRAGRRLRRQPGAALPPQPDHALRRPRPRGRGAAHLAARHPGHGPRAARAA